MRMLEFINHEEFAFYMIDTFHNINEDFPSVSVIAKYGDAKKIIEKLVLCGIELFNVEIISPFVNCYEDEYIIDLDSEGIWCEPMKRDGKYIDTESEVIYVFGNCSSSVIKHCDSDIIFEVYVPCYDECDGYDEDDFCCECECCGCRGCSCEEDDEDIHAELCSCDDEMPGFTVSQSDDNGIYNFSFYSTNMDLVREMAEIFKK